MSYFDNIDLLDEINLMEELDMIEESKRSDLGKICSNITILFSHLIKYQYNPRKQSVSWIDTIVTKYKQIQKDTKSIKYITDSMLDDCYKAAYRDAVKENKNNVTSNTPKDRPYDWNINLVTNINNIRQYLNTYYSYENVYPFDVNDTIDHYLYNSKK